MKNRRTRIIRFSSLFFASILMIAVSLMLSVPAFAREYEMVQTDIDATVGTDGSMDVREERIFEFDGSFNGVYWNLPQGEFQGRYVSVDVVEAGEIVGGEKIVYELSSSGDNNTYSIEDLGYSLRLKIYARHSDEEAHFFITYRLNDVVSRHADVSELYWQFVTEGWDQESQNVSCTVHLPVPAGESVIPEDTVRAWGHGPIDASLAFVGDDIVYSVPGVGSSEFAEARVTFPESWLPDAPKGSDSVLESILEEERAEADKANRSRLYARIAYYGSMAVSALVAVGTAAYAIKKCIDYKKATKPQFDDKYFRDVPTADHPAVLGELYHDGKVTPELFTATLMDLTDRGVIALQHVKIKRDGLFGSKIDDDYRLVAGNKTISDLPESTHEQRAGGRIDRKAFDLMFEKVALSMAEEDYRPGTYPPMYFSSIEKYAQEHSSSYERGYDAWEAAVNSEYANRFEQGRKTVEMPVGRLVAFGSIDFILAVVFIFVSIVFGTPFPIVFVIAAALILAGVFSVFSFFIGSAWVNEEGREVRAKLKALRNWLKDFTRLNEAVPTDVVLWNRLLVMAVVLGVAEEVIEQLETVLPEILHDDYLSSTYGWYYVSSSSSRMSPASAVSSAVSTAHSVSVASEAGSSWSSGGGGGGGFSGGGGGGFGGGGGGGGGAF